MKRRRRLDCESLERRELPAVAFRAAVLCVELAPADGPGHRATLNDDLTHGVQSPPATAPLDGSLSSEAVGAFFADSSEMGSLFASPSSGDADQGAYHPASVDGVFSPFADSRASADDAHAQAWDFVRHYTAKAIRNEERVRGQLSGRHDIVQQVYVEWREDVGPAADVHRRVLEKNSPERGALRSTVRRVLDRSRYDEARRRAVPVADQAIHSPRPSRDWIDLEIDLSMGVGNLTPLERRILDMRRGGATFEEVGEAVGLSKQRIFEIYDEVIARLSALYAD
jgi:hypothetical protein